MEGRIEIEKQGKRDGRKKDKIRERGKKGIR